MDRLDEACELDQKSVTRRFDNSSAMPIDGRPENVADRGAKLLKRALLIALHEAAVANHIRGKDGGQPPLGPRRNRTFVGFRHRLAGVLSFLGRTIDSGIPAKSQTARANVVSKRGSQQLPPNIEAARAARIAALLLWSP